MIKGIKFVGVPVSNQDAALKFWTEAVGMKVGDRSALQREAALDRTKDPRRGNRHRALHARRP